MVKNRLSLNIHCASCPVASHCIAHTLIATEKEKVNAIIHRIHFVQPGEHIYLQNQSMQSIYAVYAGCCKEYTVDENGNEKINGFYFPGDLLALESLASRKYTFSAAALENSQLCAIPIDWFYDLMHKIPNLLERFITLLSDKLQKNQHIPHTTNAKRRIAAFLLDVHYRLRELEKNYDHIHLPMSQFDISNLLGLAHETVSRTLHILQHDHVIKLLHKEIYITDICSLKNIANCGEYFEEASSKRH